MNINQNVITGYRYYSLHIFSITKLQP